MFPITSLNPKTKPCAKLKQQKNGHVCRACLSTTGLKYIFSESESMKTIITYFKLITGLEVKQNDGLSPKICTRCLKILEDVEKFCCTSHKSYDFLLKLKRIRNENNTKVERNIIDDKIVNEEIETCQIEETSLETIQNTVKIEDFDTNDIDNNDIDNNYINNINNIDTNDTFDNSVTVDNDINDNSLSDSEDIPSNNNKATKNVEQKKRPKRGRPCVYAPVAGAYKCEVCSKEFRRRATYLAHVRFHKDFFVCELCGKKCRSKGVLKSHLGAIHGFEKIHKCNECDYSSSYADALRLHQRLHTGEKPYQCDYCGDSFHRRTTLIRHISLHIASECNIKCPFCPKKFRTANRLHSHKYEVHRKKVYRYGCTICERTYNRSCLVRRHARKVHNVENGPVTKILIDGANND